MGGPPECMEAYETGTVVQKLFRIVDNPELCNVYEEFLVRQYAWENFGFWYEVEMYKQEQDNDNIQRQAQLIFEKFIADGAIFEIGDLDPPTRRALAETVKQPTRNMFDALQRRVMRSLAQATVNDFLQDDLCIYFLNSVGDKQEGLHKPRADPNDALKPPPSINIQAELSRDRDPNLGDGGRGFLFHFEGPPS